MHYGFSQGNTFCVGLAKCLLHLDVSAPEKYGTWYTSKQGGPVAHYSGGLGLLQICVDFASSSYTVSRAQIVALWRRVQMKAGLAPWSRCSGCLALFIACAIHLHTAGIATGEGSLRHVFSRTISVGATHANADLFSSIASLWSLSQLHGLCTRLPMLGPGHAWMR